MTENEITYIIRGAIYKIYNEFGPGLLESVYEHLLTYELCRQELKVCRQVGVPIYYEDVRIDTGFRLDMLVENKVIIELKSVENLLPVRHKQLLTYLKLTGLKIGILVNFNTDNLNGSIFRKVNRF